MSKANRKEKQPKQSARARVAASFKGRSFRVGGYSIVAMALCLAIVVAVNLFVSAVPSVYTKIDLTDDGLFTISEQTQKLLKGLKQDVMISWVVQSGAEDSMVNELIDRYTSLSGHVKSEKLDPVANPSLTREHANLGNNSLLVTSGDVTRHVSYGEIVVTDYSNYYYDGSVTQSFEGEGALTSAIDYVTSDDLPVIYQLSGHGESQLTDSLQTAITKENMTLQTLNLLSMEAVPEDADALLVIGPQHDISSDEADRLLAYLEQGGRMLLVTEYLGDGEEMPNLARVMAHYGVSAVDGIVVEGDANHILWGTSHYLLPDITPHEITDPLIDGGYYVLMPVAQGIEVDSGLRDTLTVTQLLKTSSSAFSKLTGYDMTTYEFEEGDIYGPFAVGVAIQEATEERNTQIVWFTSLQMLDANVNATVAGGNENALLNALGWMVERENSISIRSKSLTVEPLVVPAGAASRWSIVMIGVIPAAVLAMGIILVVKRRRA